MTPEEFAAIVDKAVAEASGKSGAALIEVMQKHLSKILPIPSGPGALDYAIKTIGQQVAENETFKSWTKDGASTGKFGNFGPFLVNHPLYSLKEGETLPPLSNLVTKDVTATQFPVPSTFQPFGPFPRRKSRMRDVIPTAAIGTPRVDYAQITGFSNNAGIQVGEGALKGQSEIATVALQDTVQTIGTFMPVSRQALTDVPQLRAWLDTTLEYFLTLAEDNSILNGTGVNSLRGILNVSGIVTLNRGTDTYLDCIRKAVTKVQTAYGSGTDVSGFDPTGIVLNPADAETLDLQKDAQGRYLLLPGGFPPPADRPISTGRPVWGLTPVVSPAIASGTALVGAFDVGSTLLIYEGLTVRMTDSHSDYFRRNLLAVLAEYRAMHPIYFTKAYCRIQF